MDPEPSAVPDEAALLADLKAGDEAAFESLVRTYGGRMRAVALRMLRNDVDADDVVQEAFVSAFKALDGFRGQSALGTWLHRITVNAALMRLRKARRRNEADVEDLLPTFATTGAFSEVQPAWETLPEGPAMREELRREVRSCIAQLPDGFRNVLLLRDIEGLDYGQIADQLGVTVNAVKIRVHRARKALKTLLQPKLEGLAP